MEVEETATSKEDDVDTLIQTSSPIHNPRDDSRLSITPTRELPPDAKLSPILNRTIPGSCSLLNRGSLCWGVDGCLSYGCGNLVVVVESSTAQNLQVLTKHRFDVTRTAWSKAGDKRLCLASADNGGHIITWDVVQGESLKQFQDGNLGVSDLRWLDGRIQKTSHLLLALHPPNHLVLWNTLTASKVWKVSYNEPTLGLDLDPFNCFRLMLLSHNCVLFIEDFHPEKCPKSQGRKFYIVGAKGGSPGRTTAATDAPTPVEEKSTKGKKLSKIMRQMVLGETRESQPGNESSVECLSSTFHMGVKDLIVLAFAKEVLLVDVKLSQAVGTINLERVHSSLAAIRTCAHNDVLVILHESGSLSVWRKKPKLSVQATPSVSRSQSMAGFGRAPFVSAASLDEGYGLAGSDLMLEIAYESKVQSDHVRMGKNIKVLGLAVHPISEKQISFLTSDGRIYILDYKEKKEDTVKTFAVPIEGQVIESAYNQRLTMRCILGSSSSLLKVLRMCPALTIKNWREYAPLLVAGSITGNILVFNVASGCLLREIAVHTAEVRELEWTSGNPAQSCISCSYHLVTGSNNLVRNELVHTNILTGKTRVLRGDRGEEPKITMIRVSHAKQYFVLAFTAGPFELWDARKLCLLRTMPKKFPLVTALVWSPAHRSKKKNVSGTVELDKVSSESKLDDDLPLKEHILFTDVDSQLYHFSVEGHSIRDGTKIPAETGIGNINYIACKSELIVRGDSDGNINIWNIKERQSKNIHTGRGNIKQLRFSPGRGNMKLLVLYNTGVAVWDVKELELINELRVGLDVIGVVGVDWAASDRVLLLCLDGSVRVMGLALAGSSSPALLYHRDQPVSCASLLGPKLLNKLAFNSTMNDFKVDISEEDGIAPDRPEYNIIKAYQNIHLNTKLTFLEQNLEFAHLFGCQFEKQFWNLVYHKVNNIKLDRSFDLYCDRGGYLELQEEKCKLHLNRAADKESRAEVTARLLCLGQLEPAVKLLLETEPTEDTFLSDQLLACLISTSSSPVEGNHMSTTKMVATKLIAEGSLWAGVELLCLAGKFWDACTYLRASKHWDDCMWLAKCRLKEEEYLEITKKYSDHLVKEGRIEEAALLLASVENWGSCLEVLHLGQHWSLAARLLHHLDNSAEPVLSEAIWLEAARFLFEAGHRDGANYFCDKIGEKGAELKKEFYHVT